MRCLNLLKGQKVKFKKVELNAFRAYKNKENGTFDFTLDNDSLKVLLRSNKILQTQPKT